jgi:hypothetical protein
MRKHAVLYIVCAVILVCGQAAISFAVHGGVQGTFVAGEVLSGIFAVVVTCAAFGDVAGIERAALVERGFERGWAVILIGFGTDLLALEGFIGLATQNMIGGVLGGGILVMTATLVFATVDATISDDSWWYLIPSAIYRSVLTSLRANVFPRALILLGLGTGFDLWLGQALEQLLHAIGVAQPALWASGLAAAAVIPFVQTLATLVYLDAKGYESKMPLR